MEYAIETLNIEMFALMSMYRTLKSSFVQYPNEETENDMAGVSIKIEALQIAISVLCKIEA